MAFSRTPREAPAAVPHDRGVFVEDKTFNGLVTLRLYNCAGDLCELAHIAEEWYDESIRLELVASLDKRCPPEDHHHKDPPFPGRLPFKLL